MEIFYLKALIEEGEINLNNMLFDIRNCKHGTRNALYINLHIKVYSARLLCL